MAWRESEAGDLATGGCLGLCGDLVVAPGALGLGEDSRRTILGWSGGRLQVPAGAARRALLCMVKSFMRLWQAASRFHSC